MLKVSIIIPAWNLWDMTKACLESIAYSCGKDALLGDIEVIVADNGSTDETKTQLASTLQSLFDSRGHALTLPDNLGFAKACNAAAKTAKGTLLFFLNNDTILTENCLPPLLLALEKNPKLGIVGPLLVYPGNKVQHAGICFSPHLELVHAHHLIPAPYVLPLKPRFWQAITGAAMLMPAKLFQECGGFHEGYINGFEDLDMCCQVQQKNYKLTVVHKSIVFHHTSQTPGRFDNDGQNSALLGQRCAGFFKPDQHIVAQENGLESVLSPDLELYVGLAPAKEKALSLIFTQNFDENRCKAYLESEPYWLGGYEFLASHYEKSQRWEEALDMRLQQSKLAPLDKNFASLAYCAAHTRDTDIVTNAKQCLHDILQKTQNLQQLHNKAQTLRAWATHHNDEVFDKLFAQWMQKYPLN